MGASQRRRHARKSNVVKIDNHGNGFEDVIKEAKKVAVYVEMPQDAFKHMQLLTEEMLSMAQDATGDMQASFWIECEDGAYDLHLNTKTELNKDQRSNLLSTATSGKNEIARTPLGKLRDRFEQARASEVDHDYDELPLEVLRDLPQVPVPDPEWDGYERKVIRKEADCVKIGIKGGVVDAVVSKRYA